MSKINETTFNKILDLVKTGCTKKEAFEILKVKKFYTNANAIQKRELDFAKASFLGTKNCKSAPQELITRIEQAFVPANIYADENDFSDDFYEEEDVFIFNDKLPSFYSAKRTYTSKSKQISSKNN